MRKITRNIMVLFGLWGVLAVWYVIATGYDYGDLAGTYKVKQTEGFCTLKLNKDRTFVQEFNQSDRLETRYGSWHRYGQAHVSFSKEFIRLEGEELNGSGEAHGQFERVLGLWPTLTLAPLPGGPTLTRRLF